MRDCVLLTDPIAAAGERVLSGAVEVVRAPDGEPDTVRRLAREADGIIIRSKLPDGIFGAAPRLRAILIHGTGTDLVPLADASARGIMVANLPGNNAQSVAEYCAMAMLMLARNARTIVNGLYARPWDEVRTLGAGAHEIGAMTLGIVGVGEIGTRLARMARQGFRMRVLGNQRHLDRLPADAEPSSLDDLLRESDLVVVTCPLTPQTHHLLNEDTLALMKPSAWLINVGRGAVVREEALVEALRDRRIAGAMLDVYEHYRLAPGHPLLALDNAILTPHLAGMTVESRSRMGAAAAEEMLRMLAGERPMNLVNPECLDARPAHH
jgi:D-3-phosphoglycerate dehydrogenase / 2-oxoglutarate reductase